MASRIAIMQPYLFPYIGYFQLVFTSDVFVFYDDVNYIKGGWINRNRILQDGKPRLFTIPLKNASSHCKISKIETLRNEKTDKKLLKSFHYAYSKCKYFKPVMEIINEVFNSNCKSISQLAINSVKYSCDYLGVNTEFRISSKVYSDSEELKREERIASICNKSDTQIYINPIGGKEIYTKEWFHAQGIELHFLQSVLKEYPQKNTEFIGGLSIIDLMMNLPPKEIMEEHLPSFTLL